MIGASGWRGALAGALLASGGENSLAGQSPATGIRVRVFPERPIVERDERGQYLNFDFGLENDGDAPREVERLELSVYDGRNRLVWRQFIWAKGAAEPGFRTVPDRIVPPRGALALFNPFYLLPPDLELVRLDYRFIFGTRGIEPVEEVLASVAPRAWQPPVRLVLPVDGPALVYDGHDFYSHHRRIPLGGALARRIGLTGNPVRYANDLVPVGPAGELARGALADPTSWYAYGAPVRAPAGGEVVAAANDVPDNRIEAGELVTPSGIEDRARAASGNHVVIRHADGVYSLLAHLAPGSVLVRAGDRVEPGQPVGKIGFSGDTGFHVHLHHMLSTEATFAGEGLPAYFDRVRRVALPKSGGSAPAGRNGVRLDTGDLVESVR
jgi:hypothetical protein